MTENVVINLRGELYECVIVFEEVMPHPSKKGFTIPGIYFT